ncbi:MAG: phosphonate ABC transporter ATP-binding protein [Gemmatimonadetes bacterium]|nr:phosphonate ABC transporter ATP-binding protein [Gemmatimonadota bacterium]
MAASPASAQLTLRLTGVPAGTPTGAAIYVAGSFNGWNPASPDYRLTERDGHYSLTLPDEVRGPVEFKFTLGSWDTAEADSSGRDVANRVFLVPASGGATYTGAVAAWVDTKTRPRPASTASPSVSVLDTAFAVPQLGRTRRVWLYLPPDYATSGRRYPVLYMHDGQNLFDAATAFAGEWGVDESLDSLHAAGDPGVIVVAVDNGGQKRLDEYSPWKNARLGGGEGEAYVDFLAGTLKPYVDAHYRTLADPAHTGIMGSSMGGLISLYAGLRHPEVFGRVGVFSPALWFAPEVYAFARAADARGPRPRFYFVTGAQEGNTPEAYVRDQARMVETLTVAGFRDGTEVTAAVRPDGKHAEWFWRREFPAAYRWLFDDPHTPTTTP